MSDHFLGKIRARLQRLFTRSNWITFVGLVRANLKASDYNTALGILWSLINPLVTLVIMYFIFKAHFGEGIKAYPLYILVGIISLNFFTVSTTYMTKSFSSNRYIILNSRIPRESLVASQLFIHVFKFTIELVICIILCMVHGFFSWKLAILLPPLYIAYIAFVFGLGLFLALLYCFVRDIEHIWMLITRLLYFVTPVFFLLGNIPYFARKLVYFINPLTPFVISIRGLLMGDFNLSTYMYSLLLGWIVFMLSYGIFMTFENLAVERA